MANERQSGKLTFLRANERKDDFGPSGDSIEVEVVGRISSQPNHAFGLELRDDNKLPAHEAMFALLRDGFNHNWDITVEYEKNGNPNNGILHRVELRK